MEVNNLNNINDEELKKKLENINQQIEVALKDSTDKLNQKMKNAVKKLKKKIKEIKFEYINNFREHPIIRIKCEPEANFNYIINPILLILANLKVITEFTYSRKTKEILKRINEFDKENIIQYFIDLMTWMRDSKEGNPNYSHIHQYFKSQKSEANYLSQDPGYWFNLILLQIECNIDLVKQNDIENIITNKFAFTLCEIEECQQCHYKNKIFSNKKFIVIDLPIESNFDIEDELNNVLYNLYFGEKRKNLSKYCPNCQYINLSSSRSFAKTGKYLIINLCRKNDRMQLHFLQNLIIKNNSNEKEYEYELIAALSGINTNLNYIENMNKSIVFVKNFINNNYFEIVQGKPEKINGKFNEEISKQKPNVLIFKKKKK